MTRLAATLGLSAVAAGLVLTGLQLLPPRDGGAARAAAGASLAWTDPPRSPPARAIPAGIPDAISASIIAPAVAAEAPAGSGGDATPTETRAAPRTAAVPSPAARPVPQTRRVARVERGRRLVAQVRRGSVGRVAPGRRDDRPATPVRTASARMGGPLGDILHGLGLD